METSHLLNVSSPVGMCISLSVTRGMSRDDEQSIPCCPFPDWLSLTSKTPTFLSKTNKITSVRRIWRHEAGHKMPCGLPSSLWGDNPQTSPSSEMEEKLVWGAAEHIYKAQHISVNNKTVNLKHCQCRLPWVSSQVNLYKCTGEILCHFQWKQKR